MGVGTLPLLERGPALEHLAALARQASAGEGTVVLIGGEAGVGKTTLIRAFQEGLGRGLTGVEGACDPVGTPRPLGPLYDMAVDLGLGSVDDAVSSPSTVFGRFLDALDERAPAVVVLEDAHWADETTLDLLRHVARRIERRRAMVVVSYRDDEVGADHPLRMLIGDVIGFPGVIRLDIEPLSPDGVAVLAAGTGIDPGNLYRQTRGNPFFVTEVLLARDLRGVPSSAGDAVVARVARLPPAAQALLDAAAVVGPSVDVETLRMVADGLDGLDDCLARGLLQEHEGRIAFRHEIARMALEAALPLSRRLALHARVFRVLGGRPASDVARLAHHADAAGLDQEAVRFGVEAAEAAAKLGAHREAAAHLRRVLSRRETLALDAHATLLARYSIECAVSDDLAEAVEAGEEALLLWRRHGDPLRVGDSLRWLSRLHWMSDRPSASEDVGREAVRVLETLPASVELAWAYANLAQVRSTLPDPEGGRRWAEQAIALAERVGASDAELHARVSLGMSLLLAGDETGRELLERTVAEATTAGLHEQAARALFQLGRIEVGERRFDLADSYLARAVAYGAEHGIEFWRLYALAWQARVALEQGRWDDAEDLATLVHRLSSPRSPAVRGTATCSVLAAIATRRGQFDLAHRFLDEAMDLAGRSPGGTFQFWVPSVRAELAWLQGDDAAIAEVAALYEQMLADRQEAWATNDVALFLHKAGCPYTPPPVTAPGYGALLDGDWAKAAEKWDAKGCPYHRALALAEIDSELTRREALAILDGLGARPAATLVARRLRANGARDVPRRPRASTRSHVAGLTSREGEVLVLLAEGLRDREIAARLFLSERTVHHHVAAILRKLGVGTRGAAVAAAANLGALPDAYVSDKEKR